MLRQQAKTFNYLLRALDAGVIFFSFLLAYFLKTKISGHLYPPNEYIWIIVLVIPLWIILLKYHGAYGSFRRKTHLETFWNITKAMFFGMIILFSILFVTKSVYISRSFIMFFGLISYVFLISSRLGIKTILREIRKRGLNYRNILIVGTGNRARSYAEMINSHSELGLRIVGYVDDQPIKSDQEILGAKIIGNLKDIPSIIEKKVIDEVIIALPRSWLSRLEEIVHVCEETGTEITIIADFFDTIIAETHLTNFYGIPIITFSTTSSQQIQLLLKNIFDLFSSIFLLILSLPLFIPIALTIKLTSPGPIFYRQTRCSLNGRKFTIYKFRSMVFNAYEKQKELMKYNEMDGPVFKMTNDPRVTSVGRFLRRTSLDELPQLINVLKGDMSLVGPRPPLPQEIAQYDRKHRRRLSVKPGITGPWQVSGRNTIDFREWMKLDLDYIDKWSLWLDFKILLKTLPAIVNGKGSY
jgi:exopolysaccharide biosynthesis polyprenyl glycosylphosphotransferase